MDIATRSSQMMPGFCYRAGAEVQILATCALEKNHPRTEMPPNSCVYSIRYTDKAKNAGGIGNLCRDQNLRCGPH